MRTLVTTVVLLLLGVGSVVPEAETEEFAVIVATATVEARFTTTMMFADAPAQRSVGAVTEAVTVHVGEHHRGCEPCFDRGRRDNYWQILPSLLRNDRPHPEQ